MALSRRSFLLAAAACASPSAWSHGEHEHHAAPIKAAPAPGGTLRIDVVDTPLVDQEGRPVRLRRDVLAGRIVVVDFVYTTCTTICPIFSATMAEVQKRLGARAGRDVLLVTITVDPLRDTPRRLKEYAGRFASDRDGWIWLTGTKPNVDIANKGFGAYTPNIDDHPPMVLVGDADAGTWVRLYGFPGAGEIEARVLELVAARTRPT